MVPIYRSDGEWVAVYTEGHVFNVDGEWLGFTIGRDLYDSLGDYIGFLSDDKRLLRTKVEPKDKPRRQPPERPPRPKMPASMPLAPMLKGLPYQIIDMFEEYPNRFMFVSETRPDLD